jgi:hypothetical protein
MVACGVGRAFAEEGASAATRSGGMWMYADPQTGKIGAPPPSVRLPERAPESGLRRQAAPRFSEVPVTAPAGGMKVDLGDRYRTSVTRRVDGAGITQECVQSSAAPQ